MKHLLKRRQVGSQSQERGSTSPGNVGRHCSVTTHSGDTGHSVSLWRQGHRTPWDSMGTASLRTLRGDKSWACVTRDLDLLPRCQWGLGWASSTAMGVRCPGWVTFLCQASATTSQTHRSCSGSSGVMRAHAVTNLSVFSASLSAKEARHRAVTSRAVLPS